MIDNPYSYHWQQISAPEGSHGYMEGQDSRRVTLSQVYMYTLCTYYNSFQTNEKNANVYMYKKPKLSHDVHVCKNIHM